MSLKRLFYQVLFWRGAYFLSTFLLNILFARYYGASGSSTIYYLINLYSFVLLLASLSMESGMSYFLAKDPAEASPLSAFSLLWTMALSVLSLLLLAIYFHFFDSDIPRDLFWLTAALYIPGQLLITFFMAFFYARENSVLPNIVLVVLNGALIGFLLVAAELPSFIGRNGYLRIYFLGILIQGISLSIFFQKKFVRGWHLPGPALLRKVFSFSLIAFGANLFFFLVYRVDYWFVKKYCTADELGNYIQISKLGQLFLLIPGILAGVIFPRTVVTDGEGMPLRLARMMRIAILFFALAFLLVVFTGRWFFPLLLGPSFDKMYAPALIILPGIFSLSILTPLSAYFAGIRRPGVNVKGAFAGLIVMLAGDILFVPRWKIEGAAAVSTVGYFVCMLYSLMEFSRTNRIRLGSMLFINKEDFSWLRKQVHKVNNT